MEFRKIMSILTMATVVLAAVACKEDDETTTLPSLDGRLTFSLPPYLEQNQTVEMTATGVIHPEGKDDELSYSWTVSPEIGEDDEEEDDEDETQTSTFIQNFGDELQTYTVSCSASASGYYSLSSSRSTTVVKSGLDGTGTITGIDISGLNSPVHCSQNVFPMRRRRPHNQAATTARYLRIDWSMQKNRTHDVNNSFPVPAGKQ